MKEIQVKEIIRVYDRATLRQAITPYQLRMQNGTVLKARLIGAHKGREINRYFVVCHTSGVSHSREVYQVEYVKRW